MIYTGFLKPCECVWRVSAALPGFELSLLDLGWHLHAVRHLLHLLLLPALRNYFGSHCKAFGSTCMEQKHTAVRRKENHSHHIHSRTSHGPFPSPLQIQTSEIRFIQYTCNMKDWCNILQSTWTCETHETRHISPTNIKKEKVLDKNEVYFRDIHVM